MTKPRCGECRCFKIVPESTMMGYNYDNGICKRFPPTVYYGYTKTQDFPKVSKMSDCEEFKPRHFIKYWWGKLFHPYRGQGEEHDQKD